MSSASAIIGTRIASRNDKNSFLIINDILELMNISNCKDTNNSANIKGKKTKKS